MEKRNEKSIFLDGVLMACQEIVLSHGQDTMAQEIMRASGTMAQFLAAQKRTEYESRHMNAVIREAFRKKQTAPAQEKDA